MINTYRSTRYTICKGEKLTMKLLIGENIKRLRRTNDLTQEELAHVLGVSFQSVSRWEMGQCYPEIELIPHIATFFNISVDELMGIDILREEYISKTILHDCQCSINNGNIDHCIELARNGLKKYPNNYPLMNRLMSALILTSTNYPDIQSPEKFDDEIIALGDRIIKDCPVQVIRLEAILNLAFHHCQMHRYDQGRTLYTMLPSLDFAREAHIWPVLTDDELASNCNTLLQKCNILMQCAIQELAKRAPRTNIKQSSMEDKMARLNTLIDELRSYISNEF